MRHAADGNAFTQDVIMETVPLIDDQTEEQSDATAPLETAPDGHEPLVVEALEDRVLLASDAAMPAAVAETAPAEPVAFVAPQHVNQLAVDLGEALEASDTSTGPEQTPTSPGPAQQSAHAGESHAEAHVVEEKSELPEQPMREANEMMGNESNRNRFGLATIEPEKASQESQLGAEVGNGEQPHAGAETAVEQPARLTAGPTGRAHEPTVAEAAVQQVADELAPKLGPKAIGPLIEPELNHAPLASASEANSSPTIEETEAIVRTILQTDTKTDSSPLAAAAPVADEAGAAAQETPALTLASAEQSDHNDGLSASAVLPSVLQTSAETPAAAHDALFAGGQGVEAVLERPPA